MRPHIVLSGRTPFTRFPGNPRERHPMAETAEQEAIIDEAPQAPQSIDGTEAEVKEEPVEPSPDEQIAQLTEEKREINDRMLRIAADFENFKRRTRKEMDEAGTRGLESLLKEILPVFDNLDRAVTAASLKSESSEAAIGPMAVALLEGVRLVQKQFLATLERFQVKTFESQGKAFDPQYHEAVQQIESDTLPAGTVSTVFQRGYMAGSRLLRPAMVAVVRGRPQTTIIDHVEEPGSNGTGDTHYNGSEA